MKITRKELRRMILEQVEEPTSGPFLVLVLDEDSLKVQAFITKVLPNDDWWHTPEDALADADAGEVPGFGGQEQYTRVTILDMSKRKIQEFPGVGGFITFDETVREL